MSKPKGCYKCATRHLHCHSNCQKPEYLEYKKWLEDKHQYEKTETDYRYHVTQAKSKFATRNRFYKGKFLKRDDI